MQVCESTLDTAARGYEKEFTTTKSKVHIIGGEIKETSWRNLDRPDVKLEITLDLVK